MLNFKKIFATVIPSLDWLYILQSLEYNSWDFLKWIGKNYLRRDLQTKKKLVWTFKIYFLFFLYVNFVLINIFIASLFLRWFNQLNLVNLLLQVGFIMQVSFIYIWAANFIFEPIDQLLKILYVDQSYKILNKHKKLTVIGITGSYGKTTTKEILYQLLSSKYKVLKTPASFNTVVGVAKVIKRDLKPEHEIFIVEMGAYKKGEIMRICNLVKPRLGIITGLNEQHLDRFKTIENTLRAKTELVEALPKEGIIALNFDNEYLRDYYQKNLKGNDNLKVIPYGVDFFTDWRADQIKLNVENKQTEFTIPDGKKKINLKTNLLGKHNVLNLMGALAIAKNLGITTDQLTETVEKLEPTEHRLQLIPTDNGITVIDDAYSGNPSGIRSALDLLTQFTNQRKIIVTPGIVELGKKEPEILEALGTEMGKTCDVIILIGRQTKNLTTRVDFMVRGLRRSEFNFQNLHVVDSLEQAQGKIAGITKIGDVILFENDLPDQY